VEALRDREAGAGRPWGFDWSLWRLLRLAGCVALREDGNDLDKEGWMASNQAMFCHQ